LLPRAFYNTGAENNATTSHHSNFQDGTMPRARLAYVLLLIFLAGAAAIQQHISSPDFDLTEAIDCAKSAVITHSQNLRRSDSAFN
jgi:hypothetical protein